MFKEYRIVPATVAKHYCGDEAKYVIQQRIWFTWHDMEAFASLKDAQTFIGTIYHTK